MIKGFIFVTLLLGLLFMAFVSGTALYGATCQYQLTVVQPERETFLTCYRGKVVTLHSKLDAQGNYLSKWKVEARQLRFGKQVVFFVYSRVALIDDLKADPNDEFNQISSGYKLLFYRMEQYGSRVLIFQDFPRFNILWGDIEGRL